MLAYNDIGTYTFVFVYDCETLRSSSKSLDAEQSWLRWDYALPNSRKSCS